MESNDPPRVLPFLPKKKRPVLVPPRTPAPPGGLRITVTSSDDVDEDREPPER